MTRRLIAGFLNLALLVMLAAAVASLVHDSMVVFSKSAGLPGLTAVFGILGLFTAVVVYGLMVITPMVPKRFFIPLTLCGLLTTLLALPLLIYFYTHSAWISWGMSLAQLLLWVVIVCRLRGSWKLRWPWIIAEQLETRPFRWRNFCGFILLHLVVLLPALGIYLFGCGSLAVSHFTDKFVSLRPGGLTMQVRKYTRGDGKIVELVPMSHIGEPEFYQSLAISFSPTATVLMEGVSDEQEILKEKVGYKKTATDLGLAEQQAVFKPQGKLVPADVDLRNFSKVTLECLKKTMAIHAKGINAETLPLLLQPAPADLPENLFHDLLTRRNERLLTVLREQLRHSDHVIIPWGAAHMPGISAGVLQAGFRLQETKDYLAIRFGGGTSP
jgi:hypothetical protein